MSSSPNTPDSHRHQAEYLLTYLLNQRSGPRSGIFEELRLEVMADQHSALVAIARALLDVADAIREQGATR